MKYLLLVLLLTIPCFAKNQQDPQDQTRVSGELYNSPASILNDYNNSKSLLLNSCHRLDMLDKELKEIDLIQLTKPTCDWLIKQEVDSILNN